VANATGNAINQYVAALQELYPVAKGETRVAIRSDDRVIVTAPLPALFDLMAEVGTRLLLETDQYIILSGR
jgi:hypothetical protein